MARRVGAEAHTQTDTQTEKCGKEGRREREAGRGQREVRFTTRTKRVVVERRVLARMAHGCVVHFRIR